MSQVSPALFNPKVKCVMTIHDITPMLHPEMHTRKAVFSTAVALRMAKLCVDRYIAVSEWTKRDLVRYLAIPESLITVTHEGRDARFQPSLDRARTRTDLAQRLALPLEEPYILSVGTLEPRKNIVGLLKAYAQLRKAGVRNRLVVVGMKGWKFSPIFDLVRELSLDDHVVFPGYVSDDDLPDFYNGAEVFVYPSFYEGFGLPPLEAMSCGIPVVVSDTTSLPEVVGQAGVLVDPARPQDIAAAVLDLLRSDDKRTALSQAGVIRAELFEWSDTATRTWNVYSQLHAGTVRAPEGTRDT
jgi:glycosyltransferase involved in cell wall biosynthesis